jgi:hypothetical protein
MNHTAAAVQMADLIKDITDPKLTRWRKEQLEVQARAVANNYLRKLKENR